MRIGVGLPFKDQQGQPLDAAGLGQRARWIEDAGLDAAPGILLADDEPFTLRCGPDQAAERLAWLESLGFDDIMLNLRDPGATGPSESDITLEQLQQIRSLLPADTRPPATSQAPADHLGAAS